MDSVNVPDVISCIIAGMALLASYFTWNKTNEVTKRIAEKTLNTKFFEEIYFEDIILKLPSALSKIHHNEGKMVENCAEVQKIVYEILEKSYFYKYFDENFYNGIKENLFTIEDKLFDLQDAQDKKLNAHVLEKYKSELVSQTNLFYYALKKHYSSI